MKFERKRSDDKQRGKICLIDYFYIHYYYNLIDKFESVCVIKFFLGHMKIPFQNACKRLLKLLICHSVTKGIHGTISVA